jgi:type IV pilus assembly protein PilM
MAVRGLGLDEGSATVKAVEVEKRDGALVPVRAVAIAAAEGDGAWSAAALEAALASAGIKGRSAVLGLTGKDLVIKYQQVPAVADFQLKKIVEFELEEIKRQSGDPLAADFNVMPVRADLTSDDIVMLALTREPRIDERTARLKEAGLSARHFTPNAVALYHAFRVFGPATSGDVLVASIGRTSSDFAVIRDGDLLYARSVSSGGDLLSEALAEQFNVSKAKAESLKRELGDLRPRDRRQGISQQSEKVSYALEGAAGRLFSTVQSTLQLAKSQMQLNQLEVTKVWLTGGSAAMKGLDDYLAASLGVPVQRFDALKDAGVAVEGDASGADMTVALGLAAMAADADSWSVEVIGAGERRKREFQRRHVFTIAAILLVAAYLGLAFWRWSGDHEAATKNYLALKHERDRRQRNATKVETLKAQRADLAARVDVLEKRKAAGDGFLRSLQLLTRHLPEDLWVANLELELEETPGAAKDKTSKRPVILVDGAGKSRGTGSVEEAWTRFTQAIHSLPGGSDEQPGEEPIESQSSGREKFEYRLRVTYLKPPAKPSEQEEEPEPPPDPKKPASRKPGGP